MQNIRRVLFIQTQGENAGAQEISKLVGAGLSERGFDVEHLFFYRKSNTFSEPPRTQYCIAGRPTNPFDAFRFLWTLGKHIRNARPDAILTFQHYGNTVGGAIARLVSPAPIIANQVSSPITMNWPVRAADLVLGTLGAFKCITVNSVGMFCEYSRYPANYSSRIRHIPHGFDQKMTPLSKTEARKRLNLPGNVQLLGSVARLHPTKRLDAAIRILGGQPSWHLALVGQGPQEQELRLLAAEMNATQRVHFVGEMAPELIGDFLACLDVFVFPTQAETFGLAAVEAASAGIPVVATDLPVLREVLSYEGKPAALLVDASDDQKLADAVSRVLTDNNLRRDLAESAKGLSSRYSVSAMIDEYERMLASLHSPQSTARLQ
jgi:glycosyltransferase involved in cell wall biosynthesis